MADSYGRILDANLNRVAEGLRVLEEAGRFLEADAGTYAEIRELRHAVRELGREFPESELLHARDSLADVGAASREERHTDLPSLLRANLRRVEEGLRVLEEFSRLAAPEVASRFKELRYRSYALEKRLLTSGERPMNLGLYVILDGPTARGRRLPELAREVLSAGATALQYRDKEAGDREYLRKAEELQAICREAGALFVVNDRVAVAAALDAALHIGPEDLPLRVARRLLPKGIIGFSAGSVAEAREAEAEGADYLGVGPVFPTSSKADAGPALGLEGLREIVRASRLPVVGIGGILPENVPAVLNAGAVGVAVIAGILAAPDPGAAARRYAAALRENV